MINFGSITNNTVHIGFGDLNYLDGPSALTIMARGHIKDLLTGGGAVMTIIGKAAAGGTSIDGGWQYGLVRESSGPDVWKFRFFWGAGGSVSEFLLSATDIVVNRKMTFGITWLPNDFCHFYLDGSLDVSRASSNISIASHTDGVAINSRYDNNPGTGGGSWDLDNVLVYTTNLPASAHEEYHNGIMPRPDLVKFFWSGDAAPGYNEVIHASGGGEAGTNRNGTPTLTIEQSATRWGRLSIPNYNIGRSGEGPLPDPSGDVADEMFLELAGAARVHFVTEIDLPDGTTLKVSDAALMTDNGLYKDKIRGWSSIRKVADIWSYNIAKPSSSISYLDGTRELSRKLSGEFRGKIEGQPVRVKLVSKYVKVANWYTLFNGIFNKWELQGPGPLLKFHFGPNDKPLRAGAKLGVIDEERFPNASESRGEDVQLILGVQSKTGGAVSALRISDTEFLISAGKIVSLDEVFEDGVASVGSWSLQYSKREGYDFSEVKFTADPGDVEITVDCNGVDIFGDGSGGTLTNPADQLYTTLVNFFYDEYKTGLWKTAEEIEAAVHSAYFSEVASYFTSRNWKGKAIITRAKTGYRLLNEWTKQHKTPVFFTFGGKVAIRTNLFYRIPINLLTLTEGRHALGPLKMVTKDDNLRDQINVSYGEEQTAEIIDVTRSYNSDADINFDWHQVEEQ